jgi:hypothetical protein
MVQANRANTKTKIQTPPSCPRQPEDRGPGRGRRIKLRAGYRGERGAQGARRLEGRVRRCAPSKGDQRTAAGATLTRSVGDDRSSPDPCRPGGASVPPLPSQRPASSRTTRKDFW